MPDYEDDDEDEGDSETSFIIARLYSPATPADLRIRRFPLIGNPICNKIG